LADPDLKFLGEQIQRIQAELRDLRGVRADVSHLRAEIEDRFESVYSRLDAVESQLGRFYTEMDARFVQVHQTMATNLEAVLAAIAALKR